MVLFILIMYGITAGILIKKQKIMTSQVIIPILSFVIISSVALGQNYTMNLIPEINDGIAPSNFLAAFLLPSDRWTIEMFHSQFNIYLGTSIVMTVLYLIVIIWESKTFQNKK